MTFIIQNNSHFKIEKKMIALLFRSLGLRSILLRHHMKTLFIQWNFRIVLMQNNKYTIEEKQNKNIIYRRFLYVYAFLKTVKVSY